eukprot:comp22587_c0_seq2/m.34599 comp22587_c0_seq2/g.34599  ORF comp22587_c0_seq2/g.34599 comp22587_c0_seq2/m.34599 type:complete len:342 (-) comp22587_c0_seq2:189-1214(-)
MASTKPLVVVTGASGYIACHIVQQLLQSNLYRVRGTVRSLGPENEKRVAPLRAVAEQTGLELDLVVADLLEPSGWEKAIEGATYVMHTASPFVLVSKKEEDKVVKPAVEGTLNVLKACALPNSTVQRVVLTSSMASVCYGYDGAVLDTKVFNEDDWTDPTKVDAYTKSKTLAERAAWDFVGDLKAGDHKFELAVINPSLVVGPPINDVQGTSATLIQQMMTGGMPALPNASIGFVDVRDVAQAHIVAMTSPEAAGHRHVMTARCAFMKEEAAILDKEFGPKGYKYVHVGLKRDTGCMKTRTRTCTHIHIYRHLHTERNTRTSAHSCPILFFSATASALDAW